MFGTLFGKPKQLDFAEALKAYGRERCGTRKRTLLVGLGSQSFKSPSMLLPLGALLPRPETVCFLDAPNQIDLIDAFLASDRAAEITGLDIGSNLDVAGSGARDYSAAIARLACANLPHLADLSLGDMYRTHNGHPVYGTLGDLTAPLTACPSLKSLRLYGAFTLTAPLDLPRLASLSIHPTDDIAGDGGMPSQQTMTNVMASNLPALQRFSFDGDPDAPDIYTLPDRVLTGATHPNLVSFHFTHISPDQSDALVGLQAHLADKGA